MNPSNDRHLNTWVVYFNTSDYPDIYCARRFSGESPTTDFTSDPGIEPVRAWIKQEAVKFDGLVPTCLSRSPGDDPVIQEVWL